MLPPPAPYNSNSYLMGLQTARAGAGAGMQPQPWLVRDDPAAELFADLDLVDDASSTSELAPGTPEARARLAADRH
jgi:hypothetical protein